MFLANSGGSTIPEAFSKIAPIKNADFDSMELNEKLAEAELNILIENLLKQDDKYIDLDCWESVFWVSI